MSGVKVTNERSSRPISAVESVDGEVDGDNEDWEPGGSGVSELDQWKQPVRVATTASITIATALNAGDTIDGVTLVAGDRVLVKDQSTASQNGIYVAGTTPERAVDLDDDDEVLGAVVYVIAGTVNAATTWAVTNTAATIVDTDAIGWAAAGGGSGGGVIVQDEGTPLATTATTLNFVGAGVAATGAGATKTITVSEPAEAAHEADTSDAHDASAISVLDSGALLAATDVEAALAEIATSVTHAELNREGGQSLIKAHGSMGSTETFDPTDGNVHTGTLNANLTVTLNAPAGSGAALLELWLTEDGTGGWTVTWPGSVTEQGTHTTTLGTTSRVLVETIDGGTSWIATWVGSSGSALTVKDEGGALATAATSIDFVGPLVTASGATGAKTVTVTGALDDLTDVTITSVAAADRLRYNGSAWVNSPAIWVPVMVEDGATGLWYVVVTGVGDAVMTEVS